jgi:hypothetical protein
MSNDSEKLKKHATEAATALGNIAKDKTKDAVDAVKNIDAEDVKKKAEGMKTEILKGADEAAEEFKKGGIKAAIKNKFVIGAGVAIAAIALIFSIGGAGEEKFLKGIWSQFPPTKKETKRYTDRGMTLQTEKNKYLYNGKYKIKEKKENSDGTIEYKMVEILKGKKDKEKEYEKAIKFRDAMMSKLSDSEVKERVNKEIDKEKEKTYFASLHIWTNGYRSIGIEEKQTWEDRRRFTHWNKEADKVKNKHKQINASWVPLIEKVKEAFKEVRVYTVGDKGLIHIDARKQKDSTIEIDIVSTKDTEDGKEYEIVGKFYMGEKIIDTKGKLVYKDGILELELKKPNLYIMMRQYEYGKDK